MKVKLPLFEMIIMNLNRPSIGKLDNDNAYGEEKKKKKEEKNLNQCIISSQQASTEH